MSRHQAFVNYFVKEFEDELWYLDKVMRGDILRRAEAEPWQIVFNVVQGLLSVVPIPGLSLGFLLSKELIKQFVQHSAVAAQGVKVLKAGYQKKEELIAAMAQAEKLYDTLAGQADFKELLQQDGPVDLTALRVLIELVGRGLAERYDQVLKEYLDTQQAEHSLVPLARIAAKRLFAYLQSQPLLDEKLSGDLIAQRTRLLNGILLGNIEKSWRETLTGKVSGLLPRVLQDMQKTSLTLQAPYQKQLGRLDKFTAEGIFARSAWFDDKAIYAHAKTEWWSNKPKSLPKFGYTFSPSPTHQPPELKLSVVPSAQMSAYQEAPARAQRSFVSVSLAEIKAYLASPEIKAARAAKKIVPLSFHAFLQRQGFAADSQAVCHADLSEITDWTFANFNDVDFSGSIIGGDVSGSTWAGAYLVGITAKALRCRAEHPVDLSRAQLGFSDLSKAQLPKALLVQTDLTLSNVSGADLSGIAHEGAIWYKTNLSGVTRRDLAAEQTQHVKATQAALRARLQALDDRVSQLEQQLTPLLQRLTELERTRTSSAGGAAPAPDLLQKIAELEAQIQSQANRDFQAACEAQLRALREDLDQVAQRTDILRINVTQLQTELAELKQRYTGQVSAQMTGAGDVGRTIIAQHTAVRLSHKVNELEFYLPPLVVKSLPMSVEELMDRLNQPTDSKKETPDSKQKATSPVGDDDAFGESQQPLVALPERFDAITVTQQFLRDQESLLLMLGEPGAGKSLSTWQWVRRLIADFKPEMTGAALSQLWLPIHVELNQFSITELTGLLDRQLQAYGLSATAIKKLKQSAPGQTAEPKVLLILDGYDELRQDEKSGGSHREQTDLFKRLGGLDWAQGQLKVLVTCRRRFLPDLNEERLIFGVGHYQRYQRYELLPFTLAQISDYVRARSAGDVGGGLLKPEEYFRVLEQAPHIRSLVSNPFVLHLFLESLPRLVQDRGGRRDFDDLTRFELYHAFVDQWIERQVRRMTPAKKESLGRADDVQLVKDIKRMAMYLALSMYQQEALTAEFEDASAGTRPHDVWFAVLEQVSQEAKAEYQALSTKSPAKKAGALFGLDDSSARVPDQKTFMQQTHARALALPDLLPLNNSGVTHRWMHKSFYEYLIAAAIVALVQGDELFINTVIRFLQPRLIQTEPEALNFLHDYWMQGRLGKDKAFFQTLRTRLTTIVERSAREPHIKEASSNAATTLNWCEERFTNLKWRGVYLADADLSHSTIVDVDLSHSRCMRVNLANSILQNVNLSQADATDLDLGKLPTLEFKENISTIAQHPTQSWFAISQGNDVEILDTVTGERIGEPLRGHSSDIRCLSFSPDGRWLASVDSTDQNKEVKLWELGTQNRYQQAGSLIDKSDPIEKVIWNPNGQLAGIYTGGKIKLWAIKDRKVISAFSVEKDFWRVENILFSPNGQYLVVSGSNNWQIFDVRTQKLHGELQTGGAIAFHPRSGLLAIAIEKGSIQLFDAQKLKVQDQPFNRGESFNEVRGIRFSANGDLLALRRGDSIELWDVDNQRFCMEWAVSKYAYDLFFHWDQQSLVYPEGRTLNFATLPKARANRQSLQTYPLLLPTGAFAKALKQDLFITTSFGTEVTTQYSLQCNEQLRRGGSHVGRGVILNQDGYLAASASGIKKNQKKRHRAILGTPVIKPEDSSAKALDMSSNGQWLAIAYAQKGQGYTEKGYKYRLSHVRILELATRKPVRTLWHQKISEIPKTLLNQKTMTQSCRAVAFSPDNNLLAAAVVVEIRVDGYAMEVEKSIELWQVSTGELYTTLKSTVADCRFAFSPDGQFLAVFGKGVEIWNLHILERIFNRDIPGSVVMAWSLDGQFFALAYGSFLAIFPMQPIQQGKPCQPITITDWYCEIKNLAFIKSPAGSTTLTLGMIDGQNTVGHWIIDMQQKQDKVLRFGGVCKDPHVELWANRVNVSQAKMSFTTQRVLEQAAAYMNSIREFAEGVIRGTDEKEKPTTNPVLEVKSSPPATSSLSSSTTQPVLPKPMHSTASGQASSSSTTTTSVGSSAPGRDQKQTLPPPKPPSVFTQAPPVNVSGPPKPPPQPSATVDSTSPSRRTMPAGVTTTLSVPGAPPPRSSSPGPGVRPAPPHPPSPGPGIRPTSPPMPPAPGFGVKPPAPPSGPPSPSRPVPPPGPPPPLSPGNRDAMNPTISSGSSLSSTTTSGLSTNRSGFVAGLQATGIASPTPSGGRSTAQPDAGASRAAPPPPTNKELLAQSSRLIPGIAARDQKVATPVVETPKATCRDLRGKILTAYPSSAHEYLARRQVLLQKLTVWEKQESFSAADLTEVGQIQQELESRIGGAAAHLQHAQAFR